MLMPMRNSRMRLDKLDWRDLRRSLGCTWCGEVSDFTLRFGLQLAAEESETLAYVYMSLAHAKAVARILGEALTEYERTFGILPCCAEPAMEGAQGGGQ